MKSIAAKTLAGFDNSKPLGRLKRWGRECAVFVNGIYTGAFRLNGCAFEAPGGIVKTFRKLANAWIGARQQNKGHLFFQA